ncbi:hypothetical protein BACCOPRO_00733 [Phocaeicola coprophilus DSM 18228 = JCM 13818]|uniref:Uncharacterized protein n=1 Tax=Phocaeicola coprophilus DSM 18228 = JCM 13818 TaxID=547042 RepID=S0F5N4_9BACT|nr:hypothetical protein BACCOPRO_00733 [Phocaeicola coprophilus DSM 18228 = JCM 13818]
MRRRSFRIIKPIFSNLFVIRSIFTRKQIYNKVSKTGNNYMYIRKDTTLKAMMNNRIKQSVEVSAKETLSLQRYPTSEIYERL